MQWPAKCAPELAETASRANGVQQDRSTLEQLEMGNSWRYQEQNGRGSTGCVVTWKKLMS